MAKEPWKKCECGRITDPDEDRCPMCGPYKNPKPELIELDENEIRKLVKEGKVWTKHPARWWSQ
jgi:hypothetical protein